LNPEEKYEKNFLMNFFGQKVLLIFDSGSESNFGLSFGIS